ncbi:MAG: hypothetical protein HOQ24_13240 [Mycobacteriaceae bacterium]|nr:hypothetical protein [Mycobacteriaceae bacterium]
MTTFATPQAITAEIRVAAGDVRVVAGDRADTVVQVFPTNPAKKADVGAAAQTVVTFESGALQVRGPQPSRFGMGNPGSIQVEIALPRGSRLDGELMAGGLTTEGALGAVAVATLDGHLVIDRAAGAVLNTQRGNLTVRHTTGASTLDTRYGDITVGVAAGLAARMDVHTGLGRIRNSAAEGVDGVDISARSGFGDITIHRSELTAA